jgi:hypothetical protein
MTAGKFMLVQTPDIAPTSYRQSYLIQIKTFPRYCALSRSQDKAHARRKYFDLFELDRSPIAEEALMRIRALYAIEREIRGQIPTARQSVRQTRARPLLISFKAWLEQTLSQVSQKSGIAKAIKYSLVHWQALTRYCAYSTQREQPFQGKVNRDSRAK